MVYSESSIKGETQMCDYTITFFNILMFIHNIKFVYLIHTDKSVETRDMMIKSNINTLLKYNLVK